VVATTKNPCQQEAYFPGQSIGMLNIQNVVLPEAFSSNQALVISAQKKRRRHVIESSNEEDYKKIFRVIFLQLFSF